MTRSIANEVSNKAIYAGTETVVGTAVTPTYMWLGELDITKTQDLVDKAEATGGYFRRVTPKLGVIAFAGTYAEDLTFESYPILNQYGLAGGDVATSDANTVPGYTYVQAPSHTIDDIESATLVYGINGLGWRSKGVRFNEHTVTIDTDDADGVWKWSGPLSVQSKEALPTVVDGTLTGATATTVTDSTKTWTLNEHAGKFYFNDFGTGVGEVRLIVSNTTLGVLTVDEAFTVTPTAGDRYRIEAKMPAIAIPDYEAIPSYGTQVLIDPLTGAIGTTPVLDRIISVNYTVGTSRTSKRFLNNGMNEVSSRTGRGASMISGQIRVEFDRRDEYYNWEQLNGFKLRIRQTGDVIDATAGTTKLAQVDFEECYFSTPTEDARESNMTITLPFWAYGTVDPIEVTTKNRLATLP